MKFRAWRKSCFPVLVFLSIASAALSGQFAWRDAGPGLSMMTVTNSTPLPVIYAAVRIARADFQRDFKLTTTMASNMVVGLQSLPAQLKAIPKELGEPVAAINGDFFQMVGTMRGDPRGLHIWRGELVSDPNGPAAFWQDTRGMLHGDPVKSKLEVTWPNAGTNASGLNEPLGSNQMVLFTPRMGTLYRRSGNIRASANNNQTNWTIRPPGGREWVLEHAGSGPWLPLRVGQTLHAVAGMSEDGFTNVPQGKLLLTLGPNVVKKLATITNGTPVTITVATEPDLTGVQTALGTGPMLVRDGMIHEVTARLSDKPHPRSAIGWNDDYLYFAVVDGRQAGISVGLTLPEFADFLIELGCIEAIDMDGGQSTTLMLNGKVINHPSDGRPRDISNALVVLRKPAASED